MCRRRLGRDTSRFSTTPSRDDHAVGTEDDKKEVAVDRVRRLLGDASLLPTTERHERGGRIHCRIEPSDCIQPRIQ